MYCYLPATGILHTSKKVLYIQETIDVQLPKYIPHSYPRTFSPMRRILFLNI